MDLRRPRPGEWMAAAAGLILIASLFMDWYRPADGGQAVSGFEAFRIVDLLLVVVALAGIALPVVTAMQRPPAISIALDSLTTLLGMVILAVILIRTLNTPGLGAEEDAERLAGAWVGLAASFAIVAGGLLGMRDEGPEPRSWQPGDDPGVPLHRAPHGGAAEPSA